MDDTAQLSTKPVNQQGGSDTLVQPVQSDVQQTPLPVGGTPTQPAGREPVSLPHKELGPSRQTHDFGSVSLSEPEPYISEEVAEAGVEATPDTYKPDIPPDVAKLGVTPANAAKPVVATSTGKIVLPLTEEKAAMAKKTYSIKDSMRWLAELVLEQLKRVHEKIAH